MAYNPAIDATAGSSALVEVKGVTHRFEREGHDLVVLRDVTLAIQAGEVTVVLGPSGCGKSTLLRIMTGLIVPTSGEVLRHGTPLHGVHELRPPCRRGADDVVRAGRPEPHR